MKKFIIFLTFLVWISQEVISQNAPISTIGTVVSTGSTATVSITAINFNNIGSCNLWLLFDSTVVKATSVTTGTTLGGTLSYNIRHDSIVLGWFTFPGKTLPNNTVIFNIAFTNIAGGTSAITFFDNGYSCIWYDGGWNPLNDIPYATYYINGSITFAVPLVANFTANDTIPPKNTTVQFTDLTTGDPGPTNWNWSFSRTSIAYVNGTSATSQNPQVQFTAGGAYTVTLYDYNSYYNSTKIRTGYIVAGTPGLWDGTTSTDWNTTTNWDNWVVPVSTTNVVVPSSAPNWPVATTVTIGVNCNSITMNGASELTVNSDFIINSGTSLTITNNGTLQVGGNWTNSGTFNAGTGTVVFTGSNPSTINNGSPPVMNNFYNLELMKTGSAAWNVPAGTTITVNGVMTVNQ